MTVDEPGHDDFPRGVDGLACAEPGGQVGGRANGHDPVACDGDGAVLEDSPA
jgi:hypothetical protein